MTPLYTKDQFLSSKKFDLLQLKCEYCSKTFKVTKKHLKSHILNPNHHSKGDCCSVSCGLKHYSKKNNRQPKEVKCKQCNKLFKKLQCEIENSPNHFCSRSCSGTYNNTHRTHGTRVSKLEIYLQEQLPNLFPDLEFHFNRKDAINSELDVYIPSLQLAFELNGIFHYEPIFGEDKLSKIKNNDQRKFQACLEKEIELCTIDSSSLKYFKPDNAKKYLDIIENIIKLKW